MTPARLIVRPQRSPLEGSVPVPSDRSITHRALILAALSNGPCELRGFAYGNDNLGTLRALGALGVRFEDDGKGTVRLRGVGLAGLKAPAAEIDCGHSPTTARLLAGAFGAALRLALGRQPGVVASPDESRGRAAGAAGRGDPSRGLQRARRRRGLAAG